MARNNTVITAGMTALVTGASSGIGEHFARQLAGRSVHLVLVARNRQRLEDLALELRAGHEGLSVTVITADLSTAHGVDDLVDELSSAGVTVDVLVNNAGVGSHDRFIDQDLSALAAEIQLNCTSLVALTGRLLPGMVDRHRGGVINVASTAGFQPVPTMAVYAASKAFVLSFSEALWAETAGSGLRVLALCPGPTETRFFATAGPGKQFLTRGRQTAAHVAGVALASFDSRRSPSVIPGATNRLMASGYRLMPRATMARMAGRSVRTS